MHRFGAEWWRHPEKLLKRAWQTVGTDDLLLIPGDLSWASKARHVAPDLAFLTLFPGTKLCIKGNHDFWWESDTPLCYPGLLSPPYRIGDLGVAGTRGWDTSKEHILARERHRLERALRAIADAPVKLAMLHYPPQLFLDLLLDAGVQHCVYGHVHCNSLPADEVLALDGEELEGIVCHCVACDRIDFRPKRIL